MYTTSNDLKEELRTKIIDMCNALLADAMDLQTQCKYAHWNVKGLNFIALHELFDKVNEDVEGYVDLIAERVVQLGGEAEGTARMIVKRSRLSEYSPRTNQGSEHVLALGSTLASFGRLARRAGDTCDDMGDRDSADIFTEISRGVDKWLWMLEAHVQTER